MAVASKGASLMDDMVVNTCTPRQISTVLPEVWKVETEIDLNSPGRLRKRGYTIFQARDGVEAHPLCL